MRDRILVVAKATYLEAVRDRVLLVSVAFSVGMALFSRVLGWLSLEDTLKMVQDFSLVLTLGIAVVFVACLFALNAILVHRDRAIAAAVAPRAPSRMERALGRSDRAISGRCRSARFRSASTSSSASVSVGGNCGGRIASAGIRGRPEASR